MKTNGCLRKLHCLNSKKLYIIPSIFKTFGTSRHVSGQSRKPYVTRTRSSSCDDTFQKIQLFFEAFVLKTLQQRAIKVQIAVTLYRIFFSKTTKYGSCFFPPETTFQFVKIPRYHDFVPAQFEINTGTQKKRGVEYAFNRTYLRTCISTC